MLTSVPSQQHLAELKRKAIDQVCFENCHKKKEFEFSHYSNLSIEDILPIRHQFVAFEILCRESCLINKRANITMLFV